MLSRKKFKRIVIKIGASLFCNKNNLDSSIVRGIIKQISSLNNSGIEVVVVSSGAIALGMSILKLKARPKDLASLQAAAACGQPELMDVYRRFSKTVRGLSCAQILLTWEDFSEHTRFLNAKNTLATLLKLKTLPIINENDTVSTEEIKFGDNDRLSALVSILAEADLLIILSDVDGLLDKNKSVIRRVDKITPRIKALACPTLKKTCVGGMITKLEAARISSGSGIPCVIANGHKKDVIRQLAGDPASCGTLFLPADITLDAEKRWIKLLSHRK